MANKPTPSQNASVLRIRLEYHGSIILWLCQSHIGKRPCGLDISRQYPVQYEQDRQVNSAANSRDQEWSSFCSCCKPNRQREHGDDHWDCKRNADNGRADEKNERHHDHRPDIGTHHFPASSQAITNPQVFQHDGGVGLFDHNHNGPGDRDQKAQQGNNANEANPCSDHAKEYKREKDQKEHQPDQKRQPEDAPEIGHTFREHFTKNKPLCALFGLIRAFDQTYSADRSKEDAQYDQYKDENDKHCNDPGIVTDPLADLIKDALEF